MCFQLFCSLSESKSFWSPFWLIENLTLFGGIIAGKTKTDILQSYLTWMSKIITSLRKNIPRRLQRWISTTSQHRKTPSSHLVGHLCAGNNIIIRGKPMHGRRCPQCKYSKKKAEPAPKNQFRPRAWCWKRAPSQLCGQVPMAEGMTPR